MEVNKVVPILVKMDVEGHELNVLNGRINTLALAQIFQFEFGGCNIDTKVFFKIFGIFLPRWGSLFIGFQKVDLFAFYVILKQTSVSEQQTIWPYGNN